jgi:hypothetical protein
MNPIPTLTPCMIHFSPIHVLVSQVVFPSKLCDSMNFLSPHACYMPRTSHPPSLSLNTEWEAALTPNHCHSTSWCCAADTMFVFPTHSECKILLWQYTSHPLSPSVAAAREYHLVCKQQWHYYPFSIKEVQASIPYTDLSVLFISSVRFLMDRSNSLSWVSDLNVLYVCRASTCVN